MGANLYPNQKLSLRAKRLHHAGRRLHARWLHRRRPPSLAAIRLPHAQRWQRRPARRAAAAASAALTASFERMGLVCGAQPFPLQGFQPVLFLHTHDQPVKPGFKQAFCLMDVERTDPGAPRTAGRYSGGDQGVSVAGPMFTRPACRANLSCSMALPTATTGCLPRRTTNSWCRKTASSTIPSSPGCAFRGMPSPKFRLSGGAGNP